MCVCVVCSCVCARVWEREREGERGEGALKKTEMLQIEFLFVVRNWGVEFKTTEMGQKTDIPSPLDFFFSKIENEQQWFLNYFRLNIAMVTIVNFSFKTMQKSQIPKLFSFFNFTLRVV